MRYVYEGCVESCDRGRNTSLGNYKSDSLFAAKAIKEAEIYTFGNETVRREKERCFTLM